MTTFLWRSLQLQIMINSFSLVAGWCSASRGLMNMMQSVSASLPLSHLPCTATFRSQGQLLYVMVNSNWFSVLLWGGSQWSQLFANGSTISLSLLQLSTLPSSYKYTGSVIASLGKLKGGKKQRNEVGGLQEVTKQAGKKHVGGER